MPFVYSLIYAAVIGIIAHFVGEALPRHRLSHSRFPFRSYKWEDNGNFYEKLKIRKWKSKLPDMSRVLKDMLPKKLSMGCTSGDVEALIAETCVAEMTHYLLCLVSPVIFFIWAKTSAAVGALLTLFYIFCNIPFIIIQRFNRPHLVRLSERLSAREKRSQ